MINELLYKNMNRSPLSTILIVLGSLLGGVVLFYLGARFGPQLFWGIDLAVPMAHQGLPNEIPEEEMQALLQAETPRIRFQEVLEDKKKMEDVYLAHETDLKPLPVTPPSPPESIPEAKVAVNDSAIKEELTLPILIKKEADAKPLKPTLPIPPVVAKTEQKAKEINQPVVNKQVAVVASPKKEVVAVLPKVTPPLPIVPPPPVTPVQSAPVAPVVSATSSVSTTRYALQVGSFSDPNQAESIKAHYQQKGLSVTMKSFDLPQKGKWYRVYVGNYASREEAQKVGSTLGGGGSPLVVPLKP